jgi:2-hydroxychromene-2-carboxylate isomerase
VKREPRVHFSFRSPFSWMGISRLLQRVPDAHRRLTFIPFWDPDARTSADLTAAGAEFHYAQMSKAKHLYILHDTRRQAAKLGLKMVWPIDDNPWWELPHLGFLHAQRLGRGPEFYAAVTAARRERGENICEPDVLRGIAEEVGLDAELVLAAPESDEIRAAGADCLVKAYHDDIFGIPYFRIGRHRYWGLDRLDDFLTELLGSPSGPVPLGDPVRVLADTDTAGGCG